MKIAFIALVKLSLGQAEQAPLREVTNLPSNSYPEAVTPSNVPEETSTVLSTVDTFDLIDTVNSALTSFTTTTGIEFPVENAAQPNAAKMILGKMMGQFTGSSSLKHKVGMAVRTLDTVDTYLTKAKLETEEEIVRMENILRSLINDESDIRDRIQAVSELYCSLVEKILPFIRENDSYKWCGQIFMELDVFSTKWNVDTHHLKNVVRMLEEIAPPPIGLADVLEPGIEEYLIKALAHVTGQSVIADGTAELLSEEKEAMADAMVSYLFSPIAQSVTHQAELYRQTLAGSRSRTNPASEVVELFSRVIALAKKHNIDIQRLEEVAAQINESMADGLSGESALYL